MLYLCKKLYLNYIIMKIHTYTLQGKRPSNEDQHFNLLNSHNNNKNLYPVNFVGVFDGHG